MVKTRMTALLLSVMVFVLLSGCSQTDLFWAAKSEDVVGVWAPTEPAGSDTKLVVKSDETFEARNWPRNLMCKGTGSSVWAETQRSEDTDWRNTIDFVGKWSGRGLPNIGLFPELPCDGGTAASVWRDLSADGELQLRFFPSGFEDEFNFVTFTKSVE